MDVPIDDKFAVSKTGRKSLIKTTNGWDFLCLWKDGSTMWAPLKDFKESNPVDIAEYVVGNRISEIRLCLVGKLYFEEARSNSC